MSEIEEWLRERITRLEEKVEWLEEALGECLDRINSEDSKY